MTLNQPFELRGALTAFALALAIMAATAVPGLAAQDVAASPWDETPYGRTRLVAGRVPSDPNAPLVIGVQIELKPGWKTYWRVPGEAGVPPLFDFAGSGNLKQATVQWPVPHRYRDEYGEAIGYKDKVVFPVTLAPVDAGKPVTARLKLAYATCREICVPIQATLSLNVSRAPGGLSPHAAKVASYRALVPETVAPTRAGLVRGVRIDGTKGNARLLIELDGKAGTQPVDIFVEGPEEFYFGAPKPQKSEPGAHRLFAVPVDGVSNRTTLSGRKLTLTVVDGDKRLQQDWVMD